MTEAVLALDCSGDTYSVGLLVEGKHQTSIDGLKARAALRGLPGHAAYLLKNSGLNYESLVAVGVTRGPGSFTGVRLGVTLAKTIAMTAGCGIAAFDTLSVMAAGFAEGYDRGQVAVALDARRKELYCAVFDFAELETVVKTDVRTPAEFGELMSECSDLRVLVGSGFQAYPSLVPSGFTGLLGGGKRLSQPPVITLCEMTYQAWKSGQLQQWGEVVPEYHRQADIQVSVKPLV